jgi:hypothetical protein
MIILLPVQGSVTNASKNVFWIGDLLTLIHSQVGTTENYGAIAILHTFQFNVTHALGFSVFTNRILATDLSVSLSLQLTHIVILAQSNSFLAISCSYQFRRLNPIVFWLPVCTLQLLNSQIQISNLIAQNQSYFTTGGLPPISSSCRQAP